ncbi:MAG: FHA domain-containing protein [Gammaproteobacteria bacterium]
MPNRDQLEIIRDSGEIEFYGLDPAQGVTNIGRHPENDIVIEGPGIAPFHAMLDHRQKPYRLIVLSQEGETTLGGEHLSPNVAQEIHHWDAIGINGHTIMLLEDGPAARPGPEIASAPVPQPLPERPVPSAAVPPAMVPAPPPGPRPTPALPAALPTPRQPVGLAARPPDHSDEVIVTELSEREWTINVEQTASLQVSIANGGPIVAMFQVSVEGLDGDWVTILPPQVNLNEGQRATVTIAITPPRLPSSRAGVHHFAVVVTSPNHPGRRSQRGATLTLNPYYEFAIGELSPRQQSVSWFKQSGQAMLPVANSGNSNVLLRLEGADDERACSFEFRVPGEAVSLATQAETRLSPEEAATIPVRITPRSRRLISLRKHTYPFTITTTLLEGAQTPRMVLGQLKSAPLIGFWHILLMLLVLTSGIVFLFIPGPDPRLWSEQGGRVAATDNELTLSYNASRFKRLGPDNIFNRINGALLKLKIERKLAGAPDNTYEAVEDSLPGPAGAATDAPTLDVIYRLTVENFLSLFLPRLAQTATYEVTVVPVLPVIQVSPEETEVELGQPVTLAWTVEHADRLVLKTQDGLIIETFNQPEPAGSYQIKSADADTVYIFEAYNLYTGDGSRAGRSPHQPPADQNHALHAQSGQEDNQWRSDGGGIAAGGRRPGADRHANAGRTGNRVFHRRPD